MTDGIFPKAFLIVLLFRLELEHRIGKPLSQLEHAVGIKMRFVSNTISGEIDGLHKNRMVVFLARFNLPLPCQVGKGPGMTVDLADHKGEIGNFDIVSD